jgi:hypothetical protein
MTYAISNEPYIGMIGRIVAGADVGWFIYIKEKSAGYVTYRNHAFDFSGNQTWYTWHPSLNTLKRHFEAEKWRIEWLGDKQSPALEGRLDDVR